MKDENLNAQMKDENMYVQMKDEKMYLQMKDRNSVVVGKEKRRVTKGILLLATAASIWNHGCQLESWIQRQNMKRCMISNIGTVGNRNGDWGCYKYESGDWGWGLGPAVKWHGA